MARADAGPGARPLLRNRDFQLLWSGQAVSGLGTRVSNIAYPLLVLSATGSPAAAGVVGFVGTLPYILFQLPAGAIMDRVDRRRTMIGCEAVRALALGSLPVALWLGRLSLVQVGAVAFVEGTLFVLFRLGEVAAVRRVVEPQQYPAALAQNEGRLRAANLLGTPLGGLLFDVSRAAPFLADACSYAVSLATLLLIRTPFSEERTGAPGAHVLAEIREGAVWLWRARFVFVTVMVSAFSNLLIQALILALIVLARRQGATGSATGLVLAGFGVGGVLGSLSGAWIQRRVRPATIVLVAAWTWAVTTPLVVVLPLYALLPFLAAAAFVGAAWNVAMNTVYYRLVPDRLIGRVSSVGSLAAFGALPLGSLTGGVLLQLGGPVLCCAVLAAAMLLLAVATTLSPSVRRGPGVEE
jgi:predicted MFS family arabinose efflux permease